MTNDYQLSIVRYPSEILSRATRTLTDRDFSEAVTEEGVNVSVLADIMLDVMSQHGGIGLAAPQVGVAQRFFVMNVDGCSPRVFVNPTVTPVITDTVSSEEGCLSFPRDMVLTVQRYPMVTVTYRNIDGDHCEETFEGLAANVVQHEADHLDGVVFIERLPRKLRKALKKRLR